MFLQSALLTYIFNHDFLFVAAQHVPAFICAAEATFEKVGVGVVCWGKFLTGVRLFRLILWGRLKN